VAYSGEPDLNLRNLWMSSLDLGVLGGSLVLSSTFCGSMSNLGMEELCSPKNRHRIHHRGPGVAPGAATKTDGTTDRHRWTRIESRIEPVSSVNADGICRLLPGT